MKTISAVSLKRWATFLAISIATGCAQQSPSVSSEKGTTLNPSNKTTGTSTTLVAAAGETNQALPDPVTQEKLPVKLKELPPGAKEVADLAQAGVGNAAILAYIEKQNQRYDLSPEDIVYLSDLGLAPETIALMIRHGNDQSSSAATIASTQPGAAAQLAQTPPPPPGANPTETPVPAAAPAPAQVPPSTPEVIQVPVQPAVVSQPIITQQYFYNSLSPYGSWFNLGGYGWVWQPNCVTLDVGWRPYSHRGHWVYTDCGWYWQSDYSWGWAPFHYGRWFRHARHGWMWQPDNVWGPAWVSWRETGDHCGWAPLPPGAVYTASAGFTFHGRGVSFGFDFGLTSDCFTFVPYRHFYNRNPWHYSVPHHQVAQFYGRTRVINNITINDNRIINNGIPVAQVARASRSEIQKVTIQDMGANQVQPRREVVDRDARKMAVYRPQLPADGIPTPNPNLGKEHTMTGRNPGVTSPTAVGMAPAAKPESSAPRTFADRASSTTIAPNSTANNLRRNESISPRSDLITQPPQANVPARASEPRNSVTGATTTPAPQTDTLSKRVETRSLTVGTSVESALNRPQPTPPQPRALSGSPQAGRVEAAPGANVISPTRTLANPAVSQPVSEQANALRAEPTSRAAVTPAPVATREVAPRFQRNTFNSGENSSATPATAAPAPIRSEPRRQVVNNENGATMVPRVTVVAPSSTPQGTGSAEYRPQTYAAPQARPPVSSTRLYSPQAPVSSYAPQPASPGVSTLPPRSSGYEARPAPTYSAPNPSYAPASPRVNPTPSPSYQAPAQNYAPRPAPSVTSPAPSQAPAASAAPSQRYSPPSNSSRSESGSNNRGSNRQQER